MQRVERSDDELLTAWRGGDRWAGDRLCRRLQPALRRWLAARVPLCDVDDVLQRMWIDVVGKLRREASTSAAQSVWAFFGFARFAALRHHRELRRLSLANGPSPDLQAEESDLPDERSEALAVALRRLPATTRALLQLRYAEDIPTPELARRYDVPVGTIRSRLCTARRRLGDALDRLAAQDGKR